MEFNEKELELLNRSITNELYWLRKVLKALTTEHAIANCNNEIQVLENLQTRLQSGVK